MKAFSLFLILISFLTHSAKEKNLPKLKEKQGYLIVSYSGNYPPYHLSIISNNTIFTSQSDLSDFSSKTGYKMIVLEEGEYKYSRLKLSKRGGYYKLRDNEFVFTITAGKINYAGDLIFEYHHYDKSISSGVVNHISKIYTWLQKNNSKLIKKHELIYSGLGVDDFMSFYLNQ